VVAQVVAVTAEQHLHLESQIQVVVVVVDAQLTQELVVLVVQELLL
jgi:hypothetical protein